MRASYVFQIPDNSGSFGRKPGHGDYSRLGRGDRDTQLGPVLASGKQTMDRFRHA